MILAVDVDYRQKNALAAGLIFSNWSDAYPAKELTVFITDVAEYLPGQFYLRELPCIKQILAQIDRLPEIIIVDGYVYLSTDERPGLGKHLFDALDGKVAVIGVAKTSFKDTPHNTEIYRGESTRPLFVTAVGIDAEVAKQSIVNMHGTNRIPTLLKRVDQICRKSKTEVNHTEYKGGEIITNKLS